MFIRGMTRMKTSLPGHESTTISKPLGLDPRPESHREGRPIACLGFRAGVISLIGLCSLSHNETSRCPRRAGQGDKGGKGVAITVHSSVPSRLRSPKTEPSSHEDSNLAVCYEESMSHGALAPGYALDDSLLRRKFSLEMSDLIAGDGSRQPIVSLAEFCSMGSSASLRSPSSSSSYERTSKKSKPNPFVNFRSRRKHSKSF